MISDLKKPAGYVGLPLVFGLTFADVQAKAHDQHQPPAQQQPVGDNGIDYNILKLLNVSSATSATGEAVPSYVVNQITDVEYRVVWPRDWQVLNIAEERRDREEQPGIFALT